MNCLHLLLLSSFPHCLLFPPPIELYFLAPLLHSHRQVPNLLDFLAAFDYCFLSPLWNAFFFCFFLRVLLGFLPYLLFCLSLLYWLFLLVLYLSFKRWSFPGSALVLSFSFYIFTLPNLIYWCYFRTTDNGDDSSICISNPLSRILKLDSQLLPAQLLWDVS